jgi:hypothetical protein
METSRPDNGGVTTVTAFARVLLLRREPMLRLRRELALRPRL